MNTERADPIVIAGGGLAGSLLSIYLARKGFKVVVYEKREDLRSADGPGGRSINLALSRRGIRALGDVGLDARVLREAIPMRGRRLHEAGGPDVLLPYGRRENEYINSVSRSELNRILLDAAEAAGVGLYFGSEVDSVDPESNTLCLRSDETGDISDIPYAALIGADGAASAVRTSLDKQVGLGVSQELLEHGYKELTIPPSDDGSFQIEPEALHIWPRGTHMLIALPNTDGSFTCTLFMATDGDPGFEQILTPANLESFFGANFPDAAKLIPDLETEFFENPTGILGTIRCRRWHHGNVLILGDAAHAIVPFYGQGMNCAFEDCTRLDRILRSRLFRRNRMDRHHAGRHHVGRHPDWPAVFAEFESDRRDDANAIADMALENYIEMRDRVADPEFRLRRAVALELERRLPEHFIPGYSLVSFHSIPYSRALEMSRQQEDLLTRLTENATSLDDIDWERAEGTVLSSPGAYAPA